MGNPTISWRHGRSTAPMLLPLTLFARVPIPVPIAGSAPARPNPYGFSRGGIGALKTANGIDAARGSRL